MIITFLTSKRYVAFGSTEADEIVSDYLTTVFNKYGKENIMKHEIFLYSDNDFRVGVTVMVPDKEEVSKDKNKTIKI
jgi:hypothetical protein